MSESSRTVDVAVIGAGSAGLVARRQALAHGAKRVLLIEGGPYGTTCARVGCMPSKLLIAAADAAHDARHAETFGVRAQSVEIDGRAVMARLRRERDRFAGFVVDASEKLSPDEALRGWARFVGPGRLLVRDEEGRETSVEAKAIVVATGSKPHLPPPLRDKGPRVLTTDEIFELETLPRSLAVVGSGPIGLELGQAMTRLGVRTRIFDIADHLGVLPSPIMRERAQTLLAKELDLQLGVDELTVDVVEDGLQLSWTDNEGRAQRDEFEYVLAATGRRPQLERLDLAAAEVELDERGMPKGWDPRTGQIGEHPIFLAGDVVGDRPLLHEAAAEGRIAGINAGRWPEVRALVRYIPLAIVFSDPQIALVGTIPSEDPDDPARDWEFGEVDLSSQGRARVMAVNQGFIRVYAKHACGTIIGAEILGPRAEHLAHLLAWSIEQGLTAQRALTMPYYHPVIEEGLRTAMQELAAKLKLIARAQPLDCGPGA
ncbi:MAG: dihydrolipoyl dehydrogenase [Myxococcales bacterium]|nr:dihydrolipoyl dehydrogenase [Myxococcales bacterium]